jgi:hypothetical protein
MRLLLILAFLPLTAFGNVLCTINDTDYSSSKQYKMDLVPFAVCKRDVTTAQKTKVYKTYGITDHANYCIDHGISLFVGGSNSVTENLWPNLKDDDGQCGKQGLEKELLYKLQNGEISTSDARRAMSDYVAKRKRELYGK